MIYTLNISLTWWICEQIRLLSKRMPLKTANSVTVCLTHNATMSRKSNEVQPCLETSCRGNWPQIQSVPLGLAVPFSWANVRTDAHLPPPAGSWSLPLGSRVQLISQLAAPTVISLGPVVWNWREMGRIWCTKSCSCSAPPLSPCLHPLHPWRLYSPEAASHLIEPRLCSILKLTSQW